MCGIWFTLGAGLDPSVVQHHLQKLKARGPEGARVVDDTNFQLGFTRLAINGLTDEGMQPMRKGRYVWMCNGEIYNWRLLHNRFEIETKSHSDCEVLGPLFEKLGTQTDAPTFFRALDGVFAMVIVDTEAGLAYVARDPYGVRPLYVGYELAAESDEFGQDRAAVVDGEGKRRPVKRMVFGSELKSLPLTNMFHVEAFPPGHYACYDLKSLNRIGFEAYHTVPWLKDPILENIEEATAALRYALEQAVEKRMMTERPVAALLSGGLDSSLIAALVQRNLLRAGSPPLQTFSIGFEGSEDLRYARMVAEHIRSKHTEIVMTPEDFWAAVPEVIKDIESFDITTVRASVGNWLVSREIARRTDCKVVFNGDGSDEVLGGYKYFYRAPSNEAFEAETGRLLQDIHYFDVLRSDRSISSHGLEARTPFLDKQFVAVARAISTRLRRPDENHIEKSVLRIAMGSEDLLPYEVLWRKKEAFSDGVSGPKSWYEICQEKGLEEVGETWSELARVFTHLTPKTAEAYYYRLLFSRFYKKAERAAVPYHWMPRWIPGATDPSARTIKM
jgi:asparagine synthase (glutamine-hydrolysing)